jgi:integrase
MFAGVRPDEIMRLDWSQINLETATVSVNGKTRRRRLVPLPEIAVRLLGNVPAQCCGPVAPSHSTVRRWKRRAAQSILGGKWLADIFRHTAASYLLAKHEGAGKVALWLGNSSKILLTHLSRRRG